jgi:CheY-like chemotaxis protein
MILIVEDDPVSQRALQYLLLSRGYSSQAVTSAEEALEVLRPLSRETGGPIDGVAMAAIATGSACGMRLPEMVLIDVDLPGMSGLELVEHLRRAHPQLPCTLMSAHHKELLKRELAGDEGSTQGAGGRSAESACGNVPFLSKPLDVQKLFSVVREHDSDAVRPDGATDSHDPSR